MSDIKLFSIQSGKAKELDSQSVSLEKSLQDLIEKHLDVFFGVKFLASEFSTGTEHGGRIDTLGIDENGCPVIVEYKRSLNQNVINQGLFYLDWLMDHKAEFELLVLRNLEKEHSNSIDWSAPQLKCIAKDFTKYDEHAVKQIHRNIELIRYRKYGDALVLFELVNAASAPPAAAAVAAGGKSFSEYLKSADANQKARFEAIKEYCESLGDDVQYKILKDYGAFKRLKNFCCILVHIQTKNIILYLKVDPSSVNCDDGFARDVRKIGHYGTGDLELTIRSDEDFEKAQALIAKSYEIS